MFLLIHVDKSRLQLIVRRRHVLLQNDLPPLTIE